VVVSAADNNDSEEIVPMVAFSTARSIFCQKENQSGHDWTPSSGSTLPRLWGDPARGRQAARGEAGPGSRRTQSEQRSSVNSQLGMDARRYVEVKYSRTSNLCNYNSLMVYSKWYNCRNRNMRALLALPLVCLYFQDHRSRWKERERSIPEQ
jgi:hypothetical protein